MLDEIIEITTIAFFTIFSIAIPVSLFLGTRAWWMVSHDA